MMESALGADVEIALHLLAKRYFTASGAFHPHVIVGRARRPDSPTIPLAFRHRSASASAPESARHAHRVFHRANRLSHRRSEAGTCALTLDYQRERASDHDRVGVSGDLARLRSGRDAEPDPNRKVSHRTQRPHARLEAGGKAGARAGYSGHCDIVEKAAAGVRDRAHTFD